MWWRDSHWACAVFLILGCSDFSAKRTLPEGQFVIANGNAIDLVELPSGKRSLWPAYEGGLAMDVRALSGDSVLVVQCGTECSIHVGNVRSKEMARLGSGFMPLYLEAHGLLVFYGRKEGDDQLYLFAAPVEDLRERRLLDAAPPGRRDPKWDLWEDAESWVGRPIAISAERFVYVGPDRNLWIYDIRTHERRRTEISGCNPRVWRSSTAELVCENWERGLVWLVNLRSGAMREIDALRETRVLDYDPAQDLLFVSRFRSAWFVIETGDIMAYHFAEPSLERVVKEVFAFHAAWLPVN